VVCKRVIGLPGDEITPPGWSSQRVVVPPDCVWLEGDNPLNSVDSRYYGPVPARYIYGRVVARVWPPEEAKVISRAHGRPDHNSLYLRLLAGEPEVRAAAADALADRAERAARWRAFLAQVERARDEAASRERERAAAAAAAEAATAAAAPHTTGQPSSPYLEPSTTTTTTAPLADAASAADAHSGSSASLSLSLPSPLPVQQQREPPARPAAHAVTAAGLAAAAAAAIVHGSGGGNPHFAAAAPAPAATAEAASE
jgi:hypothetical protein